MSDRNDRLIPDLTHLLYALLGVAVAALVFIIGVRLTENDQAPLPTYTPYPTYTPPSIAPSDADGLETVSAPTEFSTLSTPAPWWEPDFPHTSEEAAAWFGGDAVRWYQLQDVHMTPPPFWSPDGRLMNGWGLRYEASVTTIVVPYGWRMDYWNGTTDHSSAYGVCGSDNPPTERSDVAGATLWKLERGSSDWVKCYGR